MFTSRGKIILHFVFVFAVLLIAQSSYGYGPDSAPPERIKLTPEPKYYKSDHEPDHPHEHSADPSRYDAGVKYPSSKEEDSEPKYDLYKPHDVHHRYGPSEEDSKYIPHSETYSKYIIPKKNPSSFGKHAWEDQNDHNDDRDKSEEIPRYGFKKENYHHPDHKNLGNEDEDLPKHPIEKDWEQKDSKTFQHEPNYRTHPNGDIGNYKHHERNEKHHKPYPEHREHHEKPLYPEHKEEHRINHGRHPYPEHRDEPRIPHYIHHKNHRIPHGNHHHQEHKEHHGYHHEGHHNPQISEKKSYPRTSHHPEHKEDHEDHHESHPPRYQHWSDKDAGSFPKHKTDKLIEELGKGNSHHVPSEPEDISKYKVFYGEPHVEEFIKEHKLDSHKSPANDLSDKPPHKEQKYIDDSIKGYPFLKRYPYVNKYHREHHFQPFVNYKPSFNFGGHRHGWIYRPKFDLYEELKKDLEIKMRLLKEHEQKLAELQKKHLEKYHALFEPQHSKMFLNHELHKPIIPNFEHRHHSHTEIHEEKHDHINPHHKHHTSYSDYPKEQDYPSHKSKYPSHYEIPRPHYDDPLPKHDHTNDEAKHYDSHQHKDDYVP